MERKVLLGVFLLILPFGSFGTDLHELVKRASDDHSWGYEEIMGPKSWKSKYPQCNGNRQSPIDIETRNVDLNENLKAFKFDNFDDDFKDADIENNGHTIQIQPDDDEAPRTFTAGGLDDQYQFLQLHFHWGSRDSQGSEHVINKKAYPLEMHMVCVNKNYPSVDVAKTKEDGLAVLGVLFKVVDEDNKDFEPIISKLSKVKKEKSTAKVDPFDLQSLLPDNTMPYYRYKGSLTTPPCLEVVTWTIFKEFVPIGKNQLEQFRQVTEDDKGEESEPLTDNFRPPQPLHNRIVEISGTSNSASSLIPSTLTAVIIILAFIP